MRFIRRITPGAGETLIRGIQLQYRQATWHNRHLPHFLIIGAQKAGTESLFFYLAQHPHILRGIRKEVHFFDGGLNPKVDNYAKGEKWYRSNFPLKERKNDRMKTFEASPLYMFNPLAAKRIFKLIPAVKIIALLRNPTERAISHYFHEKRKGREPLSIGRALHEEESRLHRLLQSKDYKNETFIHHSYKHRGLYKDQIQRYLRFFSRNQILILCSEEFFDRPVETLRRVFEFVGVDPSHKIKDLKPKNVASNKSQVDPDVYKYLNDWFFPHNQALYDLVGQRFGWEKGF